MNDECFSEVLIIFYRNVNIINYLGEKREHLNEDLNVKE